MPPAAVQTQRSDHQPDVQPSSGSRPASTAEEEPSASSSGRDAIPGTSGSDSAPSTAAAPPMSLDSTRSSASTGWPRSSAVSFSAVSRT